MKALVSSLSAALPLFLCASVPVPPPGHVAFQLLEADIGNAGWREARRIFMSREEYESYFNRPSPTEVDWAMESVVYYAAGVQSTGGYVANFLHIQSTEGGRSLMVTTSLVSPGPNCPVTLSLTRPFALASFPRPARRLSVARFQRADEELDCKQ